MSFPRCVLIIDSDYSVEKLFQALFNQYFEKNQYCVYFAQTAKQAEDFLKKKVFHLIIVDMDILLKMKRGGVFDKSYVLALQSLDQERSQWKEDNIDYFIEKPVSPKNSLSIISKCMKMDFPKKNPSHAPQIISRSPSMKNILDQIKKMSQYDSSVLITGESGVGKELIARYIHQNSLRKDQPFLAVNCGAIHAHLIESELFGHKKGSFTSALSDKKGLFEEAHQGTFFLDELGELSLELQPKLLRALQEGKIRPVGSLEEKNINVRVISATNRNLENRIQNQQFREDLFHRLNVIPIHIPPLRERIEDILPLAVYFLEQKKKKYNKTELVFSEEVLESLEDYEYPGNVRELENIVERAVLFSNGSEILKEDIVFSSKKESAIHNIVQLEVPKKGLDLDQAISQIEKTILSKTIERFQGNRKKTAELLRITPRSLKHRIRKYRLAK